MPYIFEDYLEEIRTNDGSYEAIVNCNKRYDIEVHKSTFIYKNCLDNLLWNAGDDLKLLENIRSFKRESRMGNDNSEDALTWNVFRGLEKNGLLVGFLSEILSVNLTNVKLIYWSYDSEYNTICKELQDARIQIKEDCEKGTEPDLIVLSDQAVISIEAKLFASNNVSKDNSKGALNKYIDYNECHHLLTDKTSVEAVCIDEKKYELMRNWFLGNAMAGKKDFYLLNLVLDEKEQCIESQMDMLFAEIENRHFKRITWEMVYQYLAKCDGNEDVDLLINYMRNKASFVSGKRIKTFNI